MQNDTNIDNLHAEDADAFARFLDGLDAEFAEDAEQKAAEPKAPAAVTAPSPTAPAPAAQPEAEHTVDAFLIAGTEPDVLDHYRTLASRAQETQLALVEDEVVVLDTETTGLDPVTDALIEIAAVVMCGNEQLASFQTFVDPGRHIPAEITELTGITDADVAGAPDPGVAVDMLAEFVGSRNIVAHNASFDRDFIMRQAVPGQIPGDWLDSLALSRIALPRFKTHRLHDLSRAFELHHSTHRAMDDVLALAQLWRILLYAVSCLPAGLAGFIALLAPETDWPLRGVFQTAAAAFPETHFSLRQNRAERTMSAPVHDKFDAEEVPMHFVKAADISAAYTAEGIAGRMYPGFEQRPEQVAMALEVHEALRTGTHRALEAGTGVGKSMAYLLPTALAARDNAVTMGIATKTNALMDQLVYHELPRLSKAIGGLDYIALKGYEHYPCLRKLERFASEAVDASPQVIEMIATLYTYTTQTSWGDLDALNLHWFGLPRKQIEASPNDCLKAKCPFFPRRCFLHGARRYANNADIVVTNHALLFRDIQMDNGILPPVRHWVVDEAHAVETEARRQLSHTVSARDLENVLRRISGSRNSVTANVMRKAPQADGGSMLFGVATDVDNRVDQIRSIATSFFSFVKDLNSQAESSDYEQVTLWVGPELRQSGAWACLQSPGRSLNEKLGGLIDRLRDLMSMLEQFEGTFSAQEADMANAVSDLQGARLALALVLDGEDESYVYSVQLNRNPERVGEVLTAEKLDIGTELASDFFPNVQTAVFTSATLSTGAGEGVKAGAELELPASQATTRDNPFAHFMHSCGLDLLQPEKVGCRALASSYDFEHNMTIFLPAGMPEPNARNYRDALADLLFQVHRAMGGSVLTLFTNRREMESLYRKLKPQLAAYGIEVVAQTRGTSTKSLRDRFLEDEQLSLFALRSFWEGFDAPGDTLRCVVIPKLPFGRPTDPIACERQLRESSTAWRRYSLPEAIMDLKQAAGRLIRKSDDSGYLVLADARLQTKGYGKQFLKAMPTTNIQTLSIPDIAAAMQSQRSNNELH